jgi:hypothetical protein
MQSKVAPWPLLRVRLQSSVLVLQDDGKQWRVELRSSSSSSRDGSSGSRVEAAHTWQQQQQQQQ